MQLYMYSETMKHTETMNKLKQTVTWCDHYNTRKMLSFCMFIQSQLHLKSSQGLASSLHKCWVIWSLRERLDIVSRRNLWITPTKCEGITLVNWHFFTKNRETCQTQWRDSLWGWCLITGSLQVVLVLSKTEKENNTGEMVKWCSITYQSCVITALSTQCF